MKMNVIGLAVLSSLALTACGGGGGSDGPAEPIVPPGSGSVARTKLVFESEDANCDGYSVPTPNDILFSGSNDLTLNTPPARTSEQPCFGTPAYSSSKQAIRDQLSRLDGWSATAPFIIKFSNVDSSIKLDAASVAGGSTLRIFKVSLNRPEVAPGIKAPSGLVTGIESELEANTDYKISAASDDKTGMTVRVFPLKPLSPQASYMVVVTNGAKDNKGNAVIADATYGVVKQVAPLPAGAARNLQLAVNAQEAAAASKGIVPADIIASYVFTVQSVNEVLATTRAFINSPGANPTVLVAPVAPQNLLPPPASAAPNASAAMIYAGQLTLPYFLKGATVAPNPVLNDSVVDPAVIASFWQASPTLPNGSPNPLGTNLSYANKLPAKTGDESVPLLMSVPMASVPDCAKPYPVVIFQHGITRNRADMFALSGTLASQCFATVAIDQPMHGLGASAGALFQGYSTGDANGPLRERTFGLDLMNNTTGALGTPDGNPDASGAWFINLSNFLNTRDNLRQAAADLFSLSRVVTTLDYDGGGVDFDADRIYFVGQSLGSIAGVNFAGFEPRIKAAMLSVPGGGLSRLLDGSAGFGPRIRAGLAANGVVAGTEDYESFLFAAQTVVDSGDPVNTAAASVARGFPVLVHEVVGGFNNSPSDLVIPNSVTARSTVAVNPLTGNLDLPYTVFTDGPLGGTEPLISALNLGTISATTANPSGVRGAVRFLAGAHGSLLAPDAKLDPSGTVTAEMQTQMVSFLKTAGTAVQVVNSPIVKP
ncbi:MAG: hypothetical protein HYV16_10285 [Gammaproteobacteria bacterium]|nr:hypothetical protein [Gammaproteobacteria bacterium]